MHTGEGNMTPLCCACCTCYRCCTCCLWERHRACRDLSTGHKTPHRAPPHL